MKVFHVKGKKLDRIRAPYKFLNGDVYVIQTETILWIWLGSRSYADDKAVGAWAAKVLEEEDKELEIRTVDEGDEPAEFKQLFNFEVEYGDTPGFLKHIDPEPIKDYRLLHIEENDKGEVVTREIEIESGLFESDDAFVLDVYDEIYVWLGKDSQVKEKYEAGKIGRKLDVERKRTPIIYTIEEEEEPEGFRDFVEKVAFRDDALAIRQRKIKTKEEKEKKWWQFWK